MSLTTSSNELEEQEIPTSKCASCYRDTPVTLLYPFQVAGVTKVRCNVCVDTQNRLINKYGKMRQEVNSRLLDSKINGNRTPGRRIRYLHTINFPHNAEYFLTPKSRSFEGTKGEQEGIQRFFALESRFMEAGELSAEDQVSLVGFASALVEHFSRDEQRNITFGAVSNLFNECLPSPPELPTTGENNE